MDWGSQYVLEYDVSSDEYISDGELEEGMWLSDNSDEDLDMQCRPHVSPSSEELCPPLYASRQSEPDTDDEEEEEDEEADEEGSELAGNEASSADTMSSQLVKNKEKVDKESTEDSVGSPGKYAALAKLKQEIREEATGKMPSSLVRGTMSDTVRTAPPPLIASTSTDVTPQNIVYSEIVPRPPAAPPRPPRGIMKAMPIRRQKKARVHWNKSYHSKKPSDASKVPHRTRRQDTNILAVKFNTLTEPSHMHTGDAQFCCNEKCAAIVSHMSKLRGAEEEENKTWVCEFCGTSNTVDLVPEEIPVEEDTTYLVTAAAAAQAVDHSSGTNAEESIVVFCIDTSGSMCVTTEVAGHHVLRGAAEKKEKMLSSLPTDLDVDVRRAELQFMPGQRRDTTWISRMESVQAAVETQLAQLAHTEPNKKACLITFSDDVVVVGDGRMTPVTIAGDKLSNSEALVQVAGELPMPAAVRDTHKPLAKKVSGLEESGQTALGPAVLVSVIMAAKVPGSKVIICTDGLANVGLGGLDDVKDDMRYAQVQTFYEDLGTLAMEKGVTVSLVSIRGQECRAAELGQVATRTGGTVTIVDPQTVTEEFTSILANPIIATNTISRVILHYGLYFRCEDSRESVIVREVGNVTADTELTYEYGIRTEKQAKKKSKQTVTAEAGEKAPLSEVPPLMINGQPHLPFQLQIEYTSLDGDRCLRVITQSKPITRDRSVAERDMDIGVIGSHVAKQTAALAMEGEFTNARMVTLQAQRMIHEQSHTSAQRRWEYTNFCENVTPIENEIHRMQAREHDVYGRNVSDEEPEEYDVKSALAQLSITQKSSSRIKMYSSPAATSSHPVSKKRMPKAKKVVSRRRDMSDTLSEGIFNLRHSSTQQFRSPAAPIPPQPVPHRKAHSDIVRPSKDD